MKNGGERPPFYTVATIVLVFWEKYARAL